MNDKYGHNPEQRRQRRLDRIAEGLCPVHATETIATGRTKCEKCLLTTRLSGLRTKGLPESEIEIARQAVTKFNGRCECCGSAASGNAQRGFHLDHDDKTKKFRGILCALCNLTIGHSKESIKRLEDVMGWLADWKAHLDGTIPWRSE